MLNIESLANRKNIACQFFVSDILPGKIDEQHILDINLYDYNTIRMPA